MSNSKETKAYLGECQDHLKAIAKRQVDAENNFLECITERGFTEDQAKTIFSVYLKLKAVKYSNGQGRYNVVHGGFLDKPIMENALENSVELLKKRKGKNASRNKN